MRFALYAVAALVLVSAAATAQTITGGSLANCATVSTACTWPATLTITGTDLGGVTAVSVGTFACGDVKPNEAGTSLTCALSDPGTTVGDFPIALTAGGAAPTQQAGLILGTFYGSDVQRFSAKPRAAGSVEVSAVAETAIAHGGSLTIQGSFNTASTYEIILLNTENFDNTPAPTCVMTGVTATALSCEMSVAVSTMGMFRFLVRDTTGDTNYLMGSLSLRQLSFYPPLPVITSAAGDCATNSNACVDGAELTFTGTNFNRKDAQYNVITIGKEITCAPTAVTETKLTCKLAVPESSKKAYASYAASIKVQICAMKMFSPDTSAGNLLILQTGPYDQVSGWNNLAAPAADLYVDSVNESNVHSGDDLEIFGAFDTASTYEVTVLNVQDVKNEQPATCEVKSVTKDLITCKITSIPGTMGMYRFLVRDTTKNTNYLPGSAALPVLTFYPPLPTAAKVTGDCGTDSSKCVTGGVLTFEGQNFNFRDPQYNKITIGELTGDNMITCAPTAVTATTLSCTLTVPGHVAKVKATYAISIRVQVCMMGMLAPSTPLGYLNLKAVAGNPGWTLEGSASDVVIVPAREKSSNKAAIAFAVIFAILFGILLVVVIVVMCKFQLVRRGRQSYDADAGANYWASEPNTDGMAQPVAK